MNMREDCVLSEFVIVMAGMLPVPELVKPVSPPLDKAVQLKVAPGVVELKVKIEELVPEHMVCILGILVTTGVGLTIILAVSAPPKHDLLPTTVALAIYNTVIGKAVLLTNR